MNRDVAIAMYLIIFGSVLILVAMWLTRGFSRITETLSSFFCVSRPCSHSRSRSRNRERTRRAFDESELEDETEWQTRRPRHLTERRPSGIQHTLTQEEYTSTFIHGWYLPYNVRGPSQAEPEPEPEVDVEHEDLPRYEHPPAYTNSPPSTEDRGGGHSRYESLDVTERRSAPGRRNEPSAVAVTRQRANAENDRRSPDVTDYQKPSDVF
ncbi:hypothetical protein BDW72DRAFT_193723 [Aspergillus terricola var. indicus]